MCYIHHVGCDLPDACTLGFAQNHHLFLNMVHGTLAWFLPSPQPAALPPRFSRYGRPNEQVTQGIQPASPWRTFLPWSLFHTEQLGHLSLGIKFNENTVDTTILTIFHSLTSSGLSPHII